MKAEVTLKINMLLQENRMLIGILTRHSNLKLESGIIDLLRARL